MRRLYAKFCTKSKEVWIKPDLGSLRCVKLRKRSLARSWGKAKAIPPRGCQREIAQLQY